MQFKGPTCNSVPITVATDQLDYLKKLDELSHKLHAISSMCRPGVSEDVLETALVTLKSLNKTLHLMSRKA